MDIWTAIRDGLIPLLLSLGGVDYAPAEHAVPAPAPTVQTTPRLGVVEAIDLRIGAGETSARIIITAEPNRTDRTPAPPRRLPARPRLVLPALDAL